MTMQKRFRYIAAQKTWRRWLGERQGLTYEVELTPPGCETWYDGARIFTSCPLRQEGDIMSIGLPPAVSFQMIQQLGQEQAKSLLFTDFLSTINWEKYGSFQFAHSVDWEKIRIPLINDSDPALDALQREWEVDMQARTYGEDHRAL